MLYKNDRTLFAKVQNWNVVERNPLEATTSTQEIVSVCLQLDSNVHSSQLGGEVPEHIWYRHGLYTPSVLTHVAAPVRLYVRQGRVRWQRLFQQWRNYAATVLADVSLKVAWGYCEEGGGRRPGCYQVQTNIYHANSYKRSV